MAEAVHPLERLGRWNGSEWTPVARDSVGPGRVHVFSHGWARGMRPVLHGHDGFLRVWDDEAITAEGARFDRWYAPLAAAITAIDPEAIVLAYTWVDKSATSDWALRGLRSQLHTTAAGHTLAVALRQALVDEPSRLHFVGHSHGAKVVTVAAVLQEEPPEHLTLLDSPENMLPVVGGALNDLSAYLRMLPVGRGEGKTFVDNYPSKYGIRYGEDPGLGAVVDCALDPEAFPLEDSPGPHSYPRVWYVVTAQRPELGVGFAWSPLLDAPATPEHTQLRQRRAEDGTDPWALEPAPYVRTGGVAHEIAVRSSSVSDLLLSTSGRARYRGLGWRRHGDQLAVLPIRWRSGPDDATFIISVNGSERYRSVKGWNERPDRRALIPIAGMRSGYFTYQLRLEASEPAELEVATHSVRSIDVPALAEYRSWYRPLGGAALWTATAYLTYRTARLLVRLTRTEGSA